MANVRRCNSFFLGIICASITWTISLYLYFQIIWEGAKTERRFEGTIRETRLRVNNYEQNFTNFIEKAKLRYDMLEKNSNLRRKGKYYNSDVINHLQSKRKPGSPKDHADELGMVKSADDQKVRDEGYRLHAFNVLISRAIGYHREIPDTRHFLCKNKTYPESLPSASIIICFFNEEKGTLLRTVHSILDRTSEELIHEILLVNDLSTVANLHDDLKEYIALYLPKKVKLVKTPNREGLIRARIFGARKASGKVLVFLDSHCEVNENWLPPLLSRIADSRTHVVTPIIDIINADTFQYSASPLVRGGFNWGLHFKWENFPKGTLETHEDFIKPIKSPTMAGGLFAMDRSYFTELGEYDQGMNIWGGENLEISFRVWMCGGTLEIIPCSRVGHVFRRRRPYGSPRGEDTMTRNSLRVAHVWMDEFKEYFLRERPDAGSVPYGDISDRVALRKRLNCNSFSWYLSNVYPELQIPSSSPLMDAEIPKDKMERLLRKQKKWRTYGIADAPALGGNGAVNFQPWHSRKRNYLAEFQIRLSGTNLCVQSERELLKSKGALLILRGCFRVKNQMWYQTDKNELVLGQVLCLDASSGEYPRLSKCHEMGGDQEWKVDAGGDASEKEITIYNIAAGTCLGSSDQTVNSKLVMEMCNSNSTTKKWDLVKSKMVNR